MSINKIINEIEQEEKIINEIMIDDKYILWLINFFEKNNWCNEVEFIDDISLEDRDKLGKISYLKKGIDRYASDNFIIPSNLDCGKCYFIEYQNKFYKLYWIPGFEKDFYWFVKVIDNKKVKNSINFKDVIVANKNKSNYLIKERLILLSKFIEESIELGVSSKDVIETVDDTLTKVLVRKKRNNKY